MSCYLGRNNEMTAYDLYGALCEDIKKARMILEHCLAIKFEARDSDYHGGEYFQWGKTSDEHFVLKKNIDSIDNEPAEMSFPLHQILFYVNDTARAEKLQNCINKSTTFFTLLRHEELE